MLRKKPVIFRKQYSVTKNVLLSVLTRSKYLLSKEFLRFLRPVIKTTHVFLNTKLKNGEISCYRFTGKY